MFFRVSPEISNLIGYTVGIIFSYVMDKIFTFKGKKRIYKIYFSYADGLYFKFYNS